MKNILNSVLVVFIGLLTVSALADVLELKDGTVMKNCYVRDEGIRLLVWENLDKVGTQDFKIIPRTSLARKLTQPVEVINEKGEKYSVEHNPAIIRGADYDARPEKADLSVTFIEMNPKLAGLHGRVQYSDKYFFTMKPGGFKGAADIGEDNYLEPEKVVQNLKLKYNQGEEITLTAHVRNFGFIDAEPFEYAWLIDGKELKRDKFSSKLKPMGETKFDLKWQWEDGFHKVTFKIITSQPEIAVINNEATDPLWGLGLIYIVPEEKCKARNLHRSAYGTFSFEDFYRWHIDIMNLLFEASKYPSSPDGIKARVRLDRIIYADDAMKYADEKRYSDDGIAYDQGAWIWTNSAEEIKHEETNPEYRNQTEWSLPHELGHQLGLTDWYWLDETGVDYHVWQDTGEQVTHFQKHPFAMMHWHGPQVFNEVDAGYLNQNWNKPRGYFADHAFAIPDENFLKITDINGRGVADAKIEIFQRGVVVDKDKKPGEDHGVTFYQLKEDVGMDHPVSKEPVIVGNTDKFGVIRLPNRPVKEVVTLNGFHRKANPWWYADPGRPGIMLVKVTKYDRPVYFWLEYFDFNVAWFRGMKDKFEITLQTPYGSDDSPIAPVNVKAEKLDGNKVKVTWEWNPAEIMESTYLKKAIGFKVYRRVSNEGLNDRPWFEVATLGPDAREFTIDISQRPEDMYFYSLQGGGQRGRHGVTALGETSIESAIIEAPPLKE